MPRPGCFMVSILSFWLVVGSSVAQDIVPVCGVLDDDGRLVLTVTHDGVERSRSADACVHPFGRRLGTLLAESDGRSIAGSVLLLSVLSGTVGSSMRFLSRIGETGDAASLREQAFRDLVDNGEKTTERLKAEVRIGALAELGAVGDLCSLDAKIRRLDNPGRHFTLAVDLISRARQVAREGSPGPMPRSEFRILQDPVVVDDVVFWMGCRDTAGLSAVLEAVRHTLWQRYQDTLAAQGDSLSPGQSLEAQWACETLACVGWECMRVQGGDRATEVLVVRKDGHAFIKIAATGTGNGVVRSLERLGAARGPDGRLRLGACVLEVVGDSGEARTEVTAADHSRLGKFGRFLGAIEAQQSHGAHVWIGGSLHGEGMLSNVGVMDLARKPCLFASGGESDARATAAIVSAWRQRELASSDRFEPLRTIPAPSAEIFWVWNVAATRDLLGLWLVRSFEG